MAPRTLFSLILKINVPFVNFSRTQINKWSPWFEVRWSIGFLRRYKTKHINLKNREGKQKIPGTRCICSKTPPCAKTVAGCTYTQTRNRRVFFSLGRPGDAELCDAKVERRKSIRYPIQIRGFCRIISHVVTLIRICCPKMAQTAITSTWCRTMKRNTTKKNSTPTKTHYG